VIIRFKDWTGTPHEHEIGDHDLETWIMGYTNSEFTDKYPISDLEIIDAEF
jgi:hypothetical protein